jgi:hypothetical protein
MADIRINALATTAASTASDDFVAVDGSANGTRKLNAYSPTFGGNATVGGTLTVNGGTTTLTDGVNYTGKIQSGGSGVMAITTTSGTNAVTLGTAGSGEVLRVASTGLTTLAGNLTVSGTGNNILNSGGGNLLIGTTTNVAAYKLNVYGATSANVIAANGVTPDGTKTGGTFTTILGGTGASTGSYAGTGDIAGKFIFDAYGNNFIYEAGYIQSTITTGGNTDRNLHVAAMDFYTKPTASNVPTFVQRLTGTGNVLIGTTIDGGQKLQVNGTASFAGAVGTGTLTITNTGSNGLTVNNTAGNSLAVFNASAGAADANAYFTIKTSGTDRWVFGQSVSTGAGDFEIYSIPLGASALKLAKATGAATFAGAVTGGLITSQANDTSSGIVVKRSASPYIDFYDGGTSGTIRAEILADNDGVSGGNFKIQTRNAAGTGVVLAATFDKNQDVTFAGFVGIKDGMTAPSATAGTAKIYVDTADGDLKVIFGDGTIKTIATDT